MRISLQFRWFYPKNKTFRTDVVSGTSSQAPSRNCRSGTSRFSLRWKIYSPHNSRRVLTKIAERRKYFHCGKTEKEDPPRGGLTTPGTTMNILLSCSRRVVIHTRPTHTNSQNPEYAEAGLATPWPVLLDRGAVLCEPYCSNRRPRASYPFKLWISQGRRCSAVAWY